jgi:hypothetical protein
MHMDFDLDLDLDAQDMDLDEDRGDVLPASLHCLHHRPRSHGLAREGPDNINGTGGMRDEAEGVVGAGAGVTPHGQSAGQTLGQTPGQTSTQGPPQLGAGGGLKLLQCSVPHEAVTAFVWAAVRHVVPPQLLGDRHNRR